MKLKVNGKKWLASVKFSKDGVTEPKFDTQKSLNVTILSENHLVTQKTFATNPLHFQFLIT